MAPRPNHSYLPVVLFDLDSTAEYQTRPIRASEHEHSPHGQMVSLVAAS